VTLVPRLVVTITSTTPALPAGLVAVQFVTAEQLTLDAGLFPNLTVDPRLPVLKWSPVMVTAVPPAVEPFVGLMPVTTGVPHPGNLKEPTRVCQPRSLVVV
jgi:hypothetical protein